MSDPIETLPVNYFGIQLVANPYMAKDEIWLVSEGKETTLHVHEGPEIGKDIEKWLERPRIVRLVNLGNWKESRHPKEFTCPIP